MCADELLEGSVQRRERAAERGGAAVGGAALLQGDFIVTLGRCILAMLGLRPCAALGPRWPAILLSLNPSGRRWPQASRLSASSSVPVPRWSCSGGFDCRLCAMPPGSLNAHSPEATVCKRPLDDQHNRRRPLGASYSAAPPGKPSEAPRQPSGRAAELTEPVWCVVARRPRGAETGGRQMAARGLPTGS